MSPEEPGGIEERIRKVVTYAKTNGEQAGWNAERWAQDVVTNLRRRFNHSTKTRAANALKSPVLREPTLSLATIQLRQLADLIAPEQMTVIDDDSAQSGVIQAQERFIEQNPQAWIELQLEELEDEARTALRDNKLGNWYVAVNHVFLTHGQRMQADTHRRMNLALGFVLGHSDNRNELARSVEQAINHTEAYIEFALNQKNLPEEQRPTSFEPNF